jgi:hypothetical protein
LLKNAERALRKQYGMSVEDKKNMLARQEYKCRSCKKPLTFAGSVVDHDHATGKVRGILHRSCNAGIGILGDTPESLMLAVKYLQENK